MQNIFFAQFEGISFMFTMERALEAVFEEKQWDFIFHEKFTRFMLLIQGIVRKGYSSDFGFRNGVKKLQNNAI